ncbi:MAG TPA: rRNA maturation RNase YbeY [Nitrospira sp.]|nr:rRNA maturation RNase YbeY [Nitrospira sp.]
MPVFARSHVRSSRLNLSRAASLAKNILSAVGESSSHMSLTFVGDRRMHRLNKNFRQKDRTTDVLAFAARDAHAPRARDMIAASLGDVVISVPAAVRQARQRHGSFDEEIAALLVHGILHLCGYDHERNEAEARRMRRREQTILKGLANIPRLTRRSARR